MACYLCKNDLKKTIMPKLKIHLLKHFLPNTRLLILGPLDISSQRLKKNIKRLAPTLIIMLDGGTRHKINLNKKDQALAISVGDGDSSLNSPLDFILPVKKDYSDLEFVVDCILKKKKKFQHISCMGLFSHELKEERMDHLLLNLGVIQKISKTLSIKIVMDERFLFLPAGKSSFSYQGLFSAISLTQNLLKISGKADYRLKEWTKIKALSSIGLSNQSSGKVHIESMKPIVIYFAGTNFNS